ncbi:MAG: hypothetical protein ACE5HA_04705, partial [Anaerolineae bacterium]
LFLETALTLLPNIQLTVITPADYNSQPAGTNTQYAIRNTQLTIFDRTVPALRQDSGQAGRPSTNAFFIAPPAPTAWFTPAGTIDHSQLTIDNSQPVLSRVEGLTIHDDPLMRFVDLSGLQILEAIAIPLPDWAQPLVTTADSRPGGESSTPAPVPHSTPAPLLFAGEVDGRRVVVLAFDLRNSDLVLRPAFPLLMSNLIAYLAPGARGLVPAQVQAGEPVAISVPPEVDAVSLTYPDGQRVSLVPERSRLTVADTKELGVYQIALASQSEIIEQSAFAVNLFSPAESAIAPRATLPIAGSTGGQAGEIARSQGRRELWRPLAFIALVVLLIEWLVYQRAGLAQLRRKGLEIGDWRLEIGDWRSGQ